MQGVRTAVNLSFLDRNRYYYFQAHYFSENLVVPGIEPGTSGFAARISDDQTIEAVCHSICICICIWTAPVVYLSELLTTVPEVPGSIPGASRCFEK
jgi:hypothetical protein